MPSRPTASGYRLLLRLYPRGFRTRFEPEMLDLFLARRARVHRPLAVLRFWLGTIVDTLTAAGRAWRAARSPRASRGAAFATDIVAAGRSLVRAPAGPAAIAILTALAVGAVTAVFGLVNATLLTPPPYPDPDRLVAVWERRGDPPSGRNVVGAHEFPVWRERQTTFSALSAYVYGGAGASLTGAGEPAALSSVRVTRGFFDVMGVSPALGRSFRPEEDEPGAPAVAVISYALWRDHFAGDPQIVGRDILINDVPTTVVGVAADRFRFPEGPGGRPPDVWMPIAEPIHLYRGRHYLFVVGRINDDRTLADAADDLSAIARALEAELPDDNRGHRVLVEPLGDDLARAIRPTLVTLAAAVGLLALVGCVNLAGLGAAQTAGRGPALRIRLALGASRGRIIRQLAAEYGAAAALGAAAGYAGASLLLAALPEVVPPGVFNLDPVRLDASAAAVAAGTTVLAIASLLFASLAETPREGAPDAVHGAETRSRTRRGIRPALMVAQIAATVALLAASAAVAAHWQSLERIDTGFTTDGIVSVGLGLPPARYADPVLQRDFYARLDAEFRRLPGVSAVSTASLLPLGGGLSTVALTIEGRPAPARGQEPTAGYRVVGTDYFDMLGIPVLAGRAFTSSDARLALPFIRWYPQQPLSPWQDKPQPVPVAVVSETMAKAFFPGEDPIGRRLSVIFSPMATIVGVVGDTRNWSREVAPAPELYLFDGQEPQGRMNVLIKTDQANPGTLAPVVGRTIRALDADLPIIEFDTLESVVRTELQRPGFTSLVTGLFALAAVVLMAAGLYALVALATAMRTREIGIRVALGARPAAIRRLVLGQTGVLAAGGVVLGTMLWVPLMSFLGSQIEAFAIDRRGGTTPLVTAALVVALIAAAASYGPVRRALRIDPGLALRSDR